MILWRAALLSAKLSLKIKRHNQCGVLFVIQCTYFASESASTSAIWLLADTSSASSRARSALDM